MLEKVINSIKHIKNEAEEIFKEGKRRAREGGPMLNQEQINGKWNEIKGAVRNVWGQITEDELEKTKGNIGAISGLVQRKYGETKETIQEKMGQLMNSFDNDTDKGLKPDQASFERSPTSERTAGTSQAQDTAREPKTRSKERAKFDKRSEDATAESLKNPKGTTSNSYQNPNHEEVRH